MNKHPHFSSSASAAADEVARCIRKMPIEERRIRLFQLAAMHHSTPSLAKLTRVVAISDVHTDFGGANWSWLEKQPSERNTFCIVAGDVSDSLNGVAQTLALLQSKFGAVGFVPGNHDLWIDSPAAKEHFPNAGGTHKPFTSLDKLVALCELCQRLDVCHGPAVLASVVVVPLFGWYIRGDGGSGTRSLYHPKEGEDAEMTQEAWSDNYMCVWPEPGDEAAVRWGYDESGEEVAHFLGRLNVPRIVLLRHLLEDRAVVSFSHFLGREELIFESPEERKRRQLATGERVSDEPGEKINDPNVWFNFSRVAGCDLIDEQCRALGAAVHVHGHQHRQRDRRIDGVRYVSHCLANQGERMSGLCVAGERAKQVFP